VQSTVWCQVEFMRKSIVENDQRSMEEA
jgi:hypothetical protein